MNQTLTFIVLCAALVSAAPYDWYEGTAALDNGATRDFYNREAGLSWNTIMGDWRDIDNTSQGNNAFGSVSLTNYGTGQWIEIDVVKLIENWVDGTIVNKGMLLRFISGSTTHLFRSKEYSDQSLRPQLVIVTTSGALTLYPQTDTYLSQSTYQGFGDSEDLRISTANTILFRFDLSAIGSDASITAATLRMYDYRQYSGTAELGVFRCDHGHDAPADTVRFGIAAAYEEDSGIQNDPDVLFATGFESGTWNKEWTSVGPPENFTQLESDVSNKFDTLHGKAVRARIVEGSNYGGSIVYTFSRETGAEPEEIYWRYYLRMGENWNPLTNGGKMPGISGTYGRAGWGGRPVHGDDGWSARGSFSTQVSAENPLGKRNPMGYYCYHVDMTGDYGSIWRWTIGYRGFLENNRWYSIEQYARMNTPGVNDGILRAWVDGKPAFEKTDIKFRTVDSLKIEKIWMNIYHGGTAVSPENMDLYFDNVVIAKKYIGPMASTVGTEQTIQERGRSISPATIIMSTFSNGSYILSTSASNGIYALDIFDTRGALIKTLEFDRSSNRVVWDVSASTISDGMYFVLVKTRIGTIRKTIIVVHR